MSSLPQLQIFAWVGSSPELPEDITEAIVASCANLQSLYCEGFACLSLYLSYDEADIMRSFTRSKTIRIFASTKRLTRLRSLTYRSLPSDERWDEASSIEDMLAANSLRELSLRGIHGWDDSVRSLTGLISLDVNMTWFEDASHPVSLGLILHHVISLESLTLHGLIDSSRSRVFRGFEEYPAALPRLHSLKLLSVDYHKISHIDVLCRFLEGRTSLRRLDFEIEAPWPCIILLLASFRRLPSLEVLGISAGDLNTRARMEATASDLPKTLTALRLSGLRDLAAVDANVSLPLVYLINVVSVVYWLIVLDILSVTSCRKCHVFHFSTFMTWIGLQWLRISQ